MKILPLALLIPVALCTACGGRDDSPAVTEPAPMEGSAETAQGPSPAPADTSPDPTEPAPPTAHATLTAAPGSSVQGGFTFVNQGSAISIRGEITGLEPGSEHGFHLHETGECTPPGFESAGGHFNPTEDPHGGPDSSARHLGDLPNLKADDEGRVTVNHDIEGVTLVDKDGAPTEILGKAIVLHAMPDDYETQPSGDSGARIACGVIS